MLHRRIPTSIPTEFEVGGRRSRGKIKNMNEGGVFVRTDAVPDQGEHVDVVFRTPNGSTLSLSGMVWWTTDEGVHPHAPGFGLRLLDDNEDFRRLIASSQPRTLLTGLRRRR